MMTSIATWVLTYLLHSTLLTVGALALGRWLRHRPDIMSGVYKTALVGGIATATLASVVGGGPAALDLQRDRLLAGVELVTPALPAGTVVIDDVEPVEPVESDAPTIAGALASEPVAPAPRPTPAIPGWAWLCVAALVVGLTYGIASVLYHALSLRRRLSPHTVVTEGPLVTMLMRLRRLAGVRRHVALWIAPGADVPMAVGARHPTIVLPPRAAQGLPAPQQRSVLAHELAHVSRHDPAWRLVALLVERGLSFQPLHRLVVRRMHECAEYLCDDFAARHTKQPLDLASCLTEIAGWVGPRGRVYAASAMAESSQLRGRIERLLAPPRRRRSAPWASVGLAVTLLGIVAFAPAVSRGNPHEPVTMRVVAGEAGEPGTFVVATDDGGAVIMSAETAAAAEASALAADAATRPAPTRQDQRRAAKANRKAKRALDKAMRQARKRGDAAPSRAQVEAILEQARRDAGAEVGASHKVTIIGGAQARTHGDRRRDRGEAREHRGQVRVHRSGDTKTVIVQTPDGQLRIEIRGGDGPTAMNLDEAHMRRQIESDVRRRVLEAEREAARVQRQVQRQQRELERRLRHGEPPGAFFDPFADAPAPASPPRGRFADPFANAPQPPAPPRGPVKDPFGHAPKPPSPPRGPFKNPFRVAPAPPAPPAAPSDRQRGRPAAPPAPPAAPHLVPVAA